MAMFQRKEENGLPVAMSDSGAGETVVGKSVKLEGDFSSDENVRIDGEVSGTLKTTQNLVIGSGATVEADVFAENATVSGRVSGNIDVKNKLELTENAKITGDIKTGVLSVAAGASFSGQCAMSDTEQPSVDLVKKDNEEE